MDCDAWLMAVSLLARHGGEAAAVICLQLATLHRLVELKQSAEDRAMLRFWRQTGEALIALVEPETAGPHGLH
jgi:hypothetical protein